MSRVLRPTQGTFDGIASLLLDPGQQRLIPFLGAGVSLPWKDEHGLPPFLPPAKDAIDQLAAQLSLSGSALQILDLAVHAACQVQAIEAAQAAADPPDEFPPSSSKLAEALERNSSFNTFATAQRRLGKLLHRDIQDDDWEKLIPTLKLLCSITGVGQPVPDLMTVAGYFEFSAPERRSALLRLLRTLFANKQTPTPTHELLARAAKNNLAGPFDEDYLIITTNYDRLMEVALEKYQVPYCVLTVRREPWEVVVRWSGRVKDYFKTPALFERHEQAHSGQSPGQFYFRRCTGNYVILYKIHGCLYAGGNECDSIILSDEDYVDYIYRMADNNNGTIPAPLTRMMTGRGFLFLGYSFRDWNIRAIYRKITEKRHPVSDVRDGNKVRDFAVLRRFSPYEQYYFQDREIDIVECDLKKFVGGLSPAIHDDPASTGASA